MRDERGGGMKARSRLIAMMIIDVALATAGSILGQPK
jgi:hypothetical protein